MLEIHNLAAELGLTSIKAYKLDATCSALGLRPRLFAGEVFFFLKKSLFLFFILKFDLFKYMVESLRRHGKYQKRLFDQAVQLVHPGGHVRKK